jgi:YidC/Oxa1 family membrane protein insertase
MMKFLPLFFLFLFSSFASGLVIYWSWSNILTILQQQYIKGKYAGNK